MDKDGDLVVERLPNHDVEKDVITIGKEVFFFTVEPIQSCCLDNLKCTVHLKLPKIVVTTNY